MDETGENTVILGTFYLKKIRRVLASKFEKVLGKMKVGVRNIFVIHFSFTLG